MVADTKTPGCCRVLHPRCRWPLSATPEQAKTASSRAGTVTNPSAGMPRTLDAYLRVLSIAVCVRAAHKARPTPHPIISLSDIFVALRVTVLFQKPTGLV